MQLHKIKQYNLLELLKIVTYRAPYKLWLIYRKWRIKIFPLHYRKGKCLLDDIDIHLSQNYALYYKHLRIDKDAIIQEANDIQVGYITLFDERFSFDLNKDWLTDPKTGNSWPKDTFFNDSSCIHPQCADVKYILELNKFNHLASVALAYYYTKDEKYITYIKASLTGWESCVSIEKSVANRIVMDIAYRCINLIHVTLLCADNKQYCEEVLPKVLGILDHHSTFMWVRLTNRWFKSNNDNNHNVGELVGLYVTQLFLKLMLSKNHTSKMLNEAKWLLPILDKVISSKGTYIEQSGNYSKVVAEFLMLYDIFNKSHSITNEPVEKFEKVGYLNKLVRYIYNISYDGRIHNFGDNDAALVLVPFEKTNGSPDHLFEYCHIDGGYRSIEDSSHWCYSSKDSNRVRLFTRVGKYAYYVEGAFIHAHNDLLALLLSAKGSDLFIDKGCYYYNSGIEIRKEFSGVDAHNTISVDGLEMSDFLTSGTKSYPQSNLIRSEFADASCEFEGTVKYKGINHDRKISYTGSMIRVEDNLSGEIGDRIVSLHYVLSPNIDATVEENIVRLVDRTNANTFVVTFDNVSGLNIAPAVFAPHYAKTKETTMIKCIVRDTNKAISTVIEL